MKGFHPIDRFKGPRAAALRFAALFFLLAAAPAVRAEDSKWEFLPAGTLFEPLIGSPTEPFTGLVAHGGESRFEGTVGAVVEIVRYSPPDQTRWAWGAMGSGSILLDEQGATFPMRGADWYAGIYASESSGAFENRLEAQHQSSHLGDSLQGIRPAIIYNGENLNYMISFKPLEDLRLYAGLGYWLDFYPPDNTLFGSCGTEVYGPSWGVAGTAIRVYATGHLEWKNEAGGVFNQAVQAGFQWKFRKEETRAVRVAWVYYHGNSEYGQFYQEKDEHWGLGVFFDP